MFEGIDILGQDEDILCLAEIPVSSPLTIVA
jgi:hypothetical protein